MDSLISALGLEAMNMNGMLIAITEHHGGDASFVVSSLLRHCVQEGRGACLLLLHNSFGHHHNVGMKHGYNLRQLQEKGRVVVVDAFKIVGSCLGISSEVQPEVNIFSADKERVVRDLFSAVKNAVGQVLQVSSSTCIIIDDLSNLLSLAVPIGGVLSFLQYCRALVTDHSTSCLVVCTHCAAEDEAQHLLATSLMHVADVTAVVAALKTGHSTQVSGTLKVEHKRSVDAPQWNKQNFYHFRLHDRHVSLFAPGEIT